MSRPSSSRYNCQIFVRHLDKSTSDSTFESYFSRYGKVVFHKILRDKNGRSKGLGLIEYENPETAKSVLEMKNHQVDGRRIECKRSRPRRHNLADRLKRSTRGNTPNHLKRIYVGDLSPQSTDEQLKDYFSKFGNVENAFIVMDKNKKSKGYGFVMFDDPQTVDEVQKQRPHKIANKEVRTVRVYPEGTNIEDKKPTTMLYVLNYQDGINVNEIEEYFEEFGNIAGVSLRNKKSENLKYIELEFEDYDSVDVICLTRHHTIKNNRLKVQKYLSSKQVDSKKNDTAATSNSVNNETPSITPCAPPLDDLRPPAYNPFHPSSNQLYPSLPPHGATYPSTSAQPQPCERDRTSSPYAYSGDQLKQIEEQANRLRKVSNDKKDCVIS